jgi:hypothetical protein
MLRRTKLPSLKLVLWNMEWIDDLFVSNEGPSAFRPDDTVPVHHSRATVWKRRDHLAGALDELSPDIVVIVEGPNRPQELQRFFDADVEGEWRTGVWVTKGMSQCVAGGLRIRPS